MSQSSSSGDGRKCRDLTVIPKPRWKRAKVEVPDHFNNISNDKGELKAICNNCDGEYDDEPESFDTSAMKNHLASCAKFALANGRCDGDGPLDTWEFNQDATRKSLSQMIIVEELPFRFVEGEGFKEFMAAVCPRFQVPSQWDAARDCFKIYADEKNRLKQLVRSSSNRVSLTTKTWTSLQGTKYICLMAHFIDNDWKLHQKIINFFPISTHKAEAMGEAIEKCLRDWGIKKVFTITADSASSNDAAISYLQKRFNNFRTSVLGGKYLHVRCIAQIINLLVNDELKEMADSVARVRGAVRYVRQSPSRLVKFKECAFIVRIQGKSLLCLDVPSCWNSTYLMLKQAQNLETAFEDFDDRDPNFRRELRLGNGMPDESDWANVRRLTLFLEAFYDLTINVSGSSCITSDAFLCDIYCVYATLKDLEMNSDVELSAMAKRMKDKFDRYWVEKTNMLFYIASILDPSKKFAFLEFCFGKIYSSEQSVVMIKKVQEAVGELFDEYKMTLKPQSEKVGENSSSRQVVESTNEVRTGNLNDSKSVLDEYRRYMIQSGKQNSKSELDKYLSEELEDIELGAKFDILLWWKCKSRRFPILSALARDVLAVPVSSIAAESVFNTDGCVLDEYRGSLTPKIVQALICAQDWLREYPQFKSNGAKQSDYEDDVEEQDKLDLDFAKLALDPVIDEGSAFHHLGWMML